MRRNADNRRAIESKVTPLERVEPWTIAHLLSDRAGAQLAGYDIRQIRALDDRRGQCLGVSVFLEAGPSTVTQTHAAPEGFVPWWVIAVYGEVYLALMVLMKPRLWEWTFNPVLEQAVAEVNLAAQSAPELDPTEAFRRRMARAAAESEQFPLTVAAGSQPLVPRWDTGSFVELAIVPVSNFTGADLAAMLTLSRLGPRLSHEELANETHLVGRQLHNPQAVTVRLEA